MPQSLPFKSVLAILILAAAFVAQTAYIARDKSPVTDTIAFHAPNGYAYLMTRDFRMSPATPPLLRELMALPWIFYNPVLNLTTPAWETADSEPFGKEFFYQDNRDIALKLLYSSRAVNIALGLGLIALVFAWSRRLYGVSAGLAAMVIACFSPVMVAFSGTANIEIGTALFYFGTVYFLYRAWETQVERRFPWISAVFWGLALATKYTAILLAPILLYFALRKRGWLKGIREFVGYVFISLSVVWTSYLFEFKPLLGGMIPRLEEKTAVIRETLSHGLSTYPEVVDRLMHYAQTIPIPLSTWALGLAGIFRSHRADYRHYFWGQWREEQVWHHYLTSFAFKMTLGFLVLMLLRALWIRAEKKITLQRTDYLVLPPAILFLMTCFDSTGQGIRYVIPALPFLWVWVSGLWPIVSNQKWLKIACGCLLIFHIISAARVFPYPHAYFNELIGGPKNGYRYFRGGDLEWGQELRRLGAYAQERGISRIKTRLFGTRDESFYNIPGVALEPDEFIKPRREVYAVSVFYLEHLKWHADYEPTDQIGHAIWIYDMRNPA